MLAWDWMLTAAEEPKELRLPQLSISTIAELSFPDQHSLTLWFI